MPRAASAWDTIRASTNLVAPAIPRVHPRSVLTQVPCWICRPASESESRESCYQMGAQEGGRRSASAASRPVLSFLDACLSHSRDNLLNTYHAASPSFIGAAILVIAPSFRGLPSCPLIPSTQLQFFRLSWPCWASSAPSGTFETEEVYLLLRFFLFLYTCGLLSVL